MGIIGADTYEMPLTTAQRGIWVGEKISPPGTVFNIAETIEILGAIDPRILAAALRALTAEMETVRVRVGERNGVPVQVIQSEFTDAFPLIDVSGAADPRAAAHAAMMAELTKPVDFDRDPLWVGRIYKAAEDHYFWYHRSHHIIMDGFTGGQVARRAAELYTAIAEGREPEPHNFGRLSTLVESEIAYRQSDAYVKDRAFWAERLAGLPEPVSLARRHRPSSGGLLRETAHLPAASATKLREMVRGTGISLPQVLISLVAAYYFRITGAPDLVLGLPVTARPSGVLRRVPGMVANAVPIRLAMSADMTMETLCQQTARRVREALRHQRYRYEDLRRDLGLMMPHQQIAWIGVNIEPFDYALRFGEHPAIPHNLCNGSIEDLMVFIYDRGDNQDLRIDFDANPALYDAPELADHARRLLRLVEAVTADPAAPIGSFDLLGPAERERLLYGWNATASEAAAPSLPALFARQATRTPDAVAVRVDDAAGTTLTYRDLEARSSRVAADLIAQHIGVGDIVAVALPRTAALPIGLLGILKTGAAYLPLDYAGPAERLTAMLEDAHPVAVLTTPEHAHLFGRRGIPCLFVDPAASPQRDGALLFAGHRPAADQTAYVIYTSGSTGRPKAVEVTHGNLANFLAAMRQELAPTAADRFLAVTTATFDIAGLELFLPLTVGAQVVVAQTETIRDPLALHRLVREAEITVMQATPSLWRILLANPDVSLVGVHALVGGEALPAELARRLLHLADRVTNLYGPTETTIWSTCARLDMDALDPPPIGRPIRNTRVYVLDERRAPVPTGIAGELYIAGDGVAKGYLHRPELAAERFLRDPFSAAGGRMYRTGDRVRWRDDGTLEFLGRADQQLKLHGFRIEPGEIESHIARYAGVEQVAVVGVAPPHGDMRLVAYVVPTEGSPPDIALLREHVAARVPDYMVPSAFVLIQALPLTPSGKLDQKALPAPALVAGDRAEPQTPTQATLATLWAQVLGRDDIGIHDNFFELGGDSLTAAELVAAMAAQFDFDIPLGNLFHASTIAGLASLLDEGRRQNPLDVVLPLRPVGDLPPLFCIHPIIGLGWPYASLLPHIDDRPVYALQARSLARAAEPANDSIEAMAADYIVQIRRIQPHGPYHLLGWSLGGLIAHAMAGQLREAGETVAFLGLLDAYPFTGGADIDTIPEAERVRVVLGFLGLPEAAGMPTTVDGLAAHLCQAYDLMSEPGIRAILRADPGFLGRMTETVRHHLAIAQRHVPQPVEADMLFVQATGTGTDGLEGVLDHSAQAWDGLISGKLTVHDIDCHHQEMLSPAIARRFGPIVERQLRAAARRRALALS